MGTSPVTAELLRRVESLLALVGVAVAAIVPALLPDGTFPFQMRGLAASSSAVATVAFLLALSYPEAAVSRRRSTSILAAACGVMLVALNVFLVVHIEVGEPPEEVAYLTGWAYTQTGLTELERAGIDPRQFSRAEVVEEVGYDRAPRLWGGTYWASAVAYVLSTLGLIFTAVFVAVGLSESPVRVGEPDGRVTEDPPPGGA